MKAYHIKTLIGLPIVSAIIVGPKSSKRIRLVFDSGAVGTQIHLGTLNSVGFNFHDKTPDTAIKGVTGQAEAGFLLKASRLFVLEKRLEDIALSAFDFSDWVKDGIDGLLGWDIIQQFHFEMDGPHQTLRVF